MSNWESVFSFVLPTKIIFGPGCTSSLRSEMAALGCRRPLLVTDPGVVGVGIVQKVLDELGDEFVCRIFDAVEQNPKDYNVAAGAAAYRDFGADSIIAVGGGSPIDCSKAIGVLVANHAEDIKAFEGKGVPSQPLPPLVCVPTTSGTGSELTFSSVINDTNNRYKMTIKNAYTAAKLAICDPILTLSVPPSVTASTGMDALTHAIEAFTVGCSEPISDAVALYAIELIYPNLPKVFDNGQDIDARGKMLMGSMLAGIAFSHSDVASVHCIAEALGGMYDLPHGTCNAVILPHMMSYCMDFCEERYARIARAMGLSPDKGREGAMAAVEATSQLARRVCLPDFKQLGVDPADFPAIAADSARNGSNPSNPRPMKEENYMELLNKMHFGG